MMEQRLAAAEAGAGLRLYVLHDGDPTFASEVAPAITAALPPGWTLADEPDGAAVVIASDEPLTADVVDRAGDSLRVVVTTDPESDVLTSRPDVRVVTIPSEGDMSRPVVAEYAVMMILALARNLLAMARTTVEDPWVPGRETSILTDQSTYVYNWTDLKGSGHLPGKSVGIVGAGKIGMELAQRLAPFQVRLLYTQRHRLTPAEERRMGLEWREFDDLLRESDFIALSHRLQVGPDGNENQFGAREFAMMKPTAYLVNVARGRLIDDDALVSALRNGEIAGVALDVFRYEPLPKDHPLLALAGDRVILTPHLAAASEAEYWEYVLRGALREYDGTPVPATV
ncbi:MAG TPA: NAD(P)-dependent oxidoreductase [Nocardioidaceae bacterium]|nr:NAD(P)-dependent oxidoreductase [Nocardioidaceae bacterium]